MTHESECSKLWLYNPNIFCLFEIGLNLNPKIFEHIVVWLQSISQIVIHDRISQLLFIQLFVLQWLFADWRSNFFFVSCFLWWEFKTHIGKIHTEIKNIATNSFGRISFQIKCISVNWKPSNLRPSIFSVHIANTSQSTCHKLSAKGNAFSTIKCLQSRYG